MKECTVEDSFQSVVSTSKKRRLSSIPLAKNQSLPRHKEFIRLMNEFVEEHGSITDDEYFRVL
jgi:hypothetical protein